VIELDIMGDIVSIQDNDARRLRDAAAAEAGRSAGHRDLSLLLDRALQTRRRVAVHRGEQRALEEILEKEELPHLQLIRRRR
jgi:hypothetical protein